MNELDRWYVNKAGQIVAGLIVQDGKRVAVGDPAYLPVPYGQGKGRLQKSVPSEPNPSTSRYTARGSPAISRIVAGDDIPRGISRQHLARDNR